MKFPDRQLASKVWHRRTSRWLPAVVLSALLCSCQGPEQVSLQSNEKLPFADAYEFDLFLLSEWESRVVPEAVSFELKQSDVDKILNTGEDDCADCKEYQSIFQFGSEGTLYFYPYGVPSEDSLEHPAIACTKLSDSEECDPNIEDCEIVEPECDPNIEDCEIVEPECDPNIEDCGIGDCNPETGENCEAEECDPDDPDCDPEAMGAPEAGDPDPVKWRCTYYQTGGSGIDYVWNNVLSDETSALDPSQIIKIGNGDSVGSSTTLSLAYDDMPAVHMLNMLGFDADTIGNHNFDVTMEHFQNVINRADYKIVISNMYNLPNNLEHTAQYKIIEIPAVGEDGLVEPKDNLTHRTVKVALLGIIDEMIAQTITRGSFGTMEVSDYCSVINTMEEAYNQNARVFVLLSHITGDSANVRNFFNAFFALNEKFSHAVTSAKSKKKAETKAPEGDNKSLVLDDGYAGFYEDYPCSSRLIVTHDMLKKYRESSTERANATADDLRSLMRQEIFEGIAFIFGEGNDSNPLLTPMAAGSNLTNIDCGENQDPMLNDYYIQYDVNGCYSMKAEDNQNLDKKIFDSADGGALLGRLSEANIISNYSACFDGEDQKDQKLVSCNENDGIRGKALSKFGLKSFNFKINDESREGDSQSHVIWFNEIPLRGSHTAKARFIIKPKEEIPGLTNRISVHLNEYKLEPVIDPLYEERYKSQLDCERLFDSAFVPQVCKDYKDLYLEYLRCCGDGQDNDKVDTSKNNCPVFSGQDRCNAFETLDRTESSEKCVDALFDVMDNDSSNPNVPTINDMQNIWTCMYNITQLTYSTNLCWDAGFTNVHDSDANSGCYSPKFVCSFGDRYAAKENKGQEIRKFNTFTPNLILNMLLKHMNSKNSNGQNYYDSLFGSSKNGKDIDLAIFNAGNIRESHGYSIIDYDMIHTALFYNNKAVVMPFSLKKIVELLEAGLSAKVDGAFPAIAGINIAYKTINSSTKKVNEIWAVDFKQKFTDIMYLSEDLRTAIKENANSGEKTCILGVRKADEKSCMIGEYSIEGNNIKGTVYACDESVGGEYSVVCRSIGHAMPEPEEFFISNDVQEIQKSLEKNYKVLITDYIYNMGDGFDTVLKDVDRINHVDISKDYLYDIFEGILQHDDKMICKYDINASSDDDEFEMNTLDELITYNLIKRIYTDKTVPESGNSMGYAVDYANALCVATQKKLAEDLSIAEDCNYKADQAAAGNGSDKDDKPVVDPVEPGEEAQG